MKGQNQWRRAGFAFSGLREAWRSEVSIRIEVVGLVFVCGFLAWLKPDLVWWGLVIALAAAILAAELMNSAIERLSDHLHPEKHDAIKAVKDMAAGAVMVLVLAATAMVVLLLLASGVIG